MIQLSESEMSVREYRLIDEQGVVAISSGIYDGVDWVKTALSSLAESNTCFPYVGLHKSQVISYVFFRHLQSCSNGDKVFALEAGRVSSDKRGIGLGFRTLSICLDAFTQQHGGAENVKILTSVDIYNKPCRHLFNKLNWTVRSRTLVWPHFKEFQFLQNHVSTTIVPHPMLQSLHLSHELISTAVFGTIPKWTELSSSHQIFSALMRLRDAGSSFLMHRLYRCETADTAATFLDSQFCAPERRSVWMLSRDGPRPPVLLFYRATSVDPTDREPDNMYSACAVDGEGVECCLAFADRRHADGELFRMAFDGGLAREEIEDSVLLSKLNWEEHFVFESPNRPKVPE